MEKKATIKKIATIRAIKVNHFVRTQPIFKPFRLTKKFWTSLEKIQAGPEEEARGKIISSQKQKNDKPMVFATR